MDLRKSQEWYSPSPQHDRIHIIGCGSVGSTVAELLARYGFTRFTLYDFDRVEAKNIVNQMFTEKDIGRMKTEALLDILTNINPEIRDVSKVRNFGYANQNLDGYVFLCVDSVELRAEILKNAEYMPTIKTIFDVRTGLTVAQSFASDWSKSDDRERMIGSAKYTDEESKQAMPRSACGEILGVAGTVRWISTMCVCNFINYLRTGKMAKVLSINTEELESMSIF